MPREAGFAGRGSENTGGRAGLNLGKSMNTPPRTRFHFFLSYSLIDLPVLP